jgi:hypothetical protein
VSGSDIYRVEIGVQPLEAARWEAIVNSCSGQVASVIELLQGRLSKAVMETVTRPGQGLFPRPQQITLHCSCPDAATMCKHVAATLYGVGARLDSEPELLFRLRHADPLELIRHAGSVPAMAPQTSPNALDGADLSALFGIDLGDVPAAPASGASPVQPEASVPPHPVPAAVPPKRAAPAAPVKRARSKTVSASELIRRGVPRHMIADWIARGVLLRTDQRGVYRTTAETESRIAAYVARGTGLSRR